MPNKEELILIGHAGKDAEADVTKNGKEMVKFSVAVSQGKGKDGEDLLPRWYSATAYGYAVSQAIHIKRGNAVYLSGKPGAYVDKEGNARFSITCFTVMILDWHKRDAAIADKPAKPVPPAEVDEDGLPF